jgi:hypothetical protein
MVLIKALKLNDRLSKAISKLVRLQVRLVQVRLG